MSNDHLTYASRLWFSGTYNLMMDGDQAYKVPDFIIIMIENGCSFIGSDRGTSREINKDKIKDYFADIEDKQWVGQLRAPPSSFLSIVKQFADKFPGPNEWSVKLNKWINTAEQYPHLWVTLDFPAPSRLSTVIITYWNYEPTFITATQHSGSLHSQPCFLLEQAAKILVEDIYSDIDNLFSAYLFETGQFTFPEHELRKLSFTYGLCVDAPAESVGTQFLTYRPIFKRILLSSSPDDLAASSLEHDCALIYTRGFIGMTGQPRLGKTPDLQVLLVKCREHNDDQVVLDMLRTLCIIGKADAHLNTISEFYVPAVNHAVDQIAASLRSVSGMAQQLRIDTELCTSFADLRSLIQRAMIIDDELANVLNNNFSIRKYLAEFLNAALDLDVITREVRTDLNFRPLLGPQTILDTRTAQAVRVGNTISECEKRLQKFLEDMLSVQTLVAGTRLTLQQKRQTLATADKSGTHGQALETCFVLMAFKEELNDIYEEIILPIFGDNKLGLRCYRADEIFGTSAIMQDVWKAIRNARFIIAELTQRNPNVLYELGISHVLRKPAILITQSMDDVPFDLKHLRCIRYSLGPAGLRKLRSDLEATVDQLLKDEAREVQVFNP
jgi:hypothetical protein